MNRFSPILFWVFLFSCSSITTGQDLIDREFASRVETEITWTEFPLADRVVDQVPTHFEKARYLTAKVESCRSGANQLTLGLRIGWFDSESGNRFRFEGPLVTFRIHRQLRIPPNEIVGDEITLQYDQEGKLLAVNLLGIGVTHVRKSPDSEKREVKVIVETDDMLVLYDETSSKQARLKAIESAPTFSFLPDKLALLDHDSKELMFFRVLQVVKDYGVIVQTMDTGPGILELEGLNLEAPAEKIPWIPVGDWSSWGPVPKVQRASEF